MFKVCEAYEVDNTKCFGGNTYVRQYNLVSLIIKGIIKKTMCLKSARHQDSGL